MPGIETPGGVPANKRDVLYDLFVQAGTFQGIFKTFFELCEELNLKPFAEHRNFYPKFKSQLTSWKAASLWSKLDKRYNRKEYKKGKACNNTRVFIIGAGPCGLRTAIECAMLGTKVVVVEKRFSFSRNNVLHLWPFLITDLRSLGAKKFFGKFCAGAIDHISIRQLQVVLLKVALIMGVEIHYGVGYEGLEAPPEDQEHEKIGWRAKLDPKDHPVSEYEFDVIVGADGKRNTLHGFKRKEFRGKLAIAITANFINRKSNEEASVEEISGVAFIFNQKFFMDLRESTGIDLENIVYYKDETHYFVMTAKKQSLLAKGVILKDLPDTAKLLRQDNYNHQKLQEYAREAADFCTNFQLPTLDYALNHHGKPDVAMFDFTSIYAADNAARVLDRNGHKLLLALVGDSLLEPFWPTGSGCARGFLSSLDAAWMIRSWSSGDMTPLEVLAERESSYRLLAQTTPENLCKIYESYGINPNSRYPHLNTKAVTPHEIRHQYDTLDEDLKAQFEILEKKPSIVLNRTASVVRSSKVQMWCQRVTDNYLNVMVENMTSSWRNGLAFCAIIHRYRPDLIDYDSLRPENVVQNNQLAFDIAEREFGITPAMTGKEMAAIACPDKLTIVAYVVRFYDLFKDELPASVKQENNTKENNIAQALPAPTKSSSKTSFLSRIASKVRRKSHEKHDKENGEKAKASGSGLGSKRKHHKHKDSAADDIVEKRKLMAQEARKANQSENNSLNVADKNELNVGVRGQNKVSGLAEQLQANLRSNYGMNTVTDGPRPKMRPLIETGNVQASQLCVFCSKRVYVMERLSAEGMFFHRDCFKCQDCDVTIRIGNYAYLPDPDGGKGRFLCREHFAARKQAVRKRSLSDKEKEAVQSKKPAFPFDSIEEVEDENENISRPNPTTPKTPKTPKGPFRKRNLLSPFFGKRSKTTPERDEMQKMYEQMAESKGALTEEEQARYNLGTSVNTDDELDESSDSELDEEEKAWLAREGLSTRMADVEEGEEDEEEEEEYEEEYEEEEEEEEESGEEYEEGEEEEVEDEEEEEEENSEMEYEEEDDEEEESSGEYYTDSDEYEDDDEEEDDEEEDDEEEEEEEEKPKEPSYSHVHTLTSLKLQWLNDTKAPQMAPWKPPEVIKREKEEAERKRREEEEERRRVEEEERLQKEEEERKEKEEEERKRLEEEERRQLEPDENQDGDEAEEDEDAAKDITEEDVINALRSPTDGGEEWSDRRKKWRDKFATKFASYEDDTEIGRRQKVEMGGGDAAADEEGDDQSLGMAKLDSDAHSNAKTESIDDDQEEEEDSKEQLYSGEEDVEEIGSMGEIEEEEEEEEEEEDVEEEEEDVEEEEEEDEDEEEEEREEEEEGDDSEAISDDVEQIVVGGHLAEEDDFSESFSRTEELSGAVVSLDTDNRDLKADLAEQEDDDYGETTEEQTEEEEIEVEESEEEEDMVVGDLISTTDYMEESASHSFDPQNSAQDTEQSESLLVDDIPVTDKVVISQMHGVIQGEVVNVECSSSEAEEIDIDELISSPEVSKRFSSSSASHPALLDVKPDLSPLKPNVVDIDFGDAETNDDSSELYEPSPVPYDTETDDRSVEPSDTSAVLSYTSDQVQDSSAASGPSEPKTYGTVSTSQLSTDEDILSKHSTQGITSRDSASDRQDSDESGSDGDMGATEAAGLLQEARTKGSDSGTPEDHSQSSPLPTHLDDINLDLLPETAFAANTDTEISDVEATEEEEDSNICDKPEAVASPEVDLNVVPSSDAYRTSYNSLPNRKNQRFSVGFEDDIGGGSSVDIKPEMTASPSLPEKLSEAKETPKPKPQYKCMYPRASGVRSLLSPSFSPKPSLDYSGSSPQSKEAAIDDGANKNMNNATVSANTDEVTITIDSPEEDYVSPPSAIQSESICRDTLSNKHAKVYTPTTKGKLEKQRGKKASPKKRLLKRSKDKRKSESEVVVREKGERKKHYEVEDEKEARQVSLRGAGYQGMHSGLSPDICRSCTPSDSERGSSKRKKGSGKKKEGTPSNLQVPLASDHNIPESDLSPTSDVPPCTFDGGIPRSESSSKEKKSRLSRMRPHRRDATKANKNGRRASAGMQQGEESNKDKNFRQRSASTKVDSSKPPDGAIPKQRKSRSLKLKKRSSAGKLGLSSTEGDSDREERPLSPSSLDLPLGQFGEEGARSKRKVPDVVADLGLGSPEAAATEQLPRLIKKLSVDANLTGDFDIDSTTDEEEMKRDEASTDAEPTEQITDSPRSKGKSPRRMWGKRFKALSKKTARQEQEKRKMEEEELSARLTKRVQKEARRQHHQQQLKRHRLAQEIQRQLQEVEVKQRELENRGVAAERALRGEETPEGVDETTLMQEWFSLVNEKNALVRFETELMVQARELELEDRHSQLEQELRLIMAVGEGKKSSTDRDQEKLLLDEMLEVVEQRDALVAFLEEERVKEQQEDQDFEAIMLKKGLMTAVR